MPLFLKLRELSLYAVIQKFVNLDELDSDSFADSYVAKFMNGRRQRIENELPYLFENF